MRNKNNFPLHVLQTDVVSSDVNAKGGTTGDYLPVSHHVIFGDTPQETTVSFDITVLDDDVAEFPETFHLNLDNVEGALIGQPSVATVIIEDTDGMFSYYQVLFQHLVAQML